MDQKDKKNVQPSAVEDDVMNKLPDEVYYKTLEKVVKDNLKVSIKDCDMSIIPGSAKGDNYMGVVYRIAITSKRGDKLNLIVKLPPQNQVRREQFFVKDCFLREIEFYHDIFPMYMKFQEEKGIDVVNEGFSKIPRVYATLKEEPYEGLFFEDLKMLGFELYDRFKDVTLEHAQLLMKSLGKFHAISFAIKDQKPELMKTYAALEDFFLANEHKKEMNPVKLWFDSIKTQALQAIKELDDKELSFKFENFIQDDMISMLRKGVAKEPAEPYAILNHGDCWNNNFMYHNDKNGVPADIRLLDFQVLRYCSPVCDLVYYIFGCTTKEFRDKHYFDVLDLYYETLSTYMTRLGSDPKKVFPREAFEDHLKRFGSFGLTMAIMVLPFFTNEGDDIIDMDSMAESFRQSEETGAAISSEFSDMSKKKTTRVYQKRMQGVLQDMIKYGYI